jgi:hypothetical protein
VNPYIDPTLLVRILRAIIVAFFPGAPWLDAASQIAEAIAERYNQGESLEALARDPIIWAKAPGYDALRVELMLLAVDGAVNPMASIPRPRPRDPEDVP